MTTQQMTAALDSILALVNQVLGLVSVFPVNIIATAFVVTLATGIISALIGVFRKSKKGA